MCYRNCVSIFVPFDICSQSLTYPADWQNSTVVLSDCLNVHVNYCTVNRQDVSFQFDLYDTVTFQQRDCGSLLIKLNVLRSNTQSIGYVTNRQESASVLDVRSNVGCISCTIYSVARATDFENRYSITFGVFNRCRSRNFSDNCFCYRFVIFPIRILLSFGYSITFNGQFNFSFRNSTVKNNANIRYRNRASRIAFALNVEDHSSVIARSSNIVDNQVPARYFNRWCACKFNAIRQNQTNFAIVHQSAGFTFSDREITSLLFACTDNDIRSRCYLRSNRSNNLSYYNVPFNSCGTANRNFQIAGEVRSQSYFKVFEVKRRCICIILRTRVYQVLGCTIVISCKSFKRQCQTFVCYSRKGIWFFRSILTSNIPFILILPSSTFRQRQFKITSVRASYDTVTNSLSNMEIGNSLFILAGNQSRCIFSLQRGFIFTISTNFGFRNVSGGSAAQASNDIAFLDFCGIINSEVVRNFNFGLNFIGTFITCFHRCFRSSISFNRNNQFLIVFLLCDIKPLRVKITVHTFHRFFIVDPNISIRQFNS
ncbi:hypothetical protein DJ90_6219 [Paenibacillus macerans]|uniref:Uncharacterized protein n=1 Tax=Paenibacillus macerans TaxID=44252 RepID=A0A090Y9Y4_PAEMA|nr:hypothetical protein DJ90_6219 [Paenibacillus macerans]